MRKLTLLVAGLFMLCASAVYGQSRTISGTVVTSSDNEPVIGASILVKGTTNGTISDVDGGFELQVSDGAILVVSYVGLKTTEVVAKKGMVIAMESDAVLIDEVIAVAYGTSTKKAFTGSAQTKTGEELAKMQVSDVSKSLDGAMSGVQVSSSSGQPGESAAIRIRGVGSISASQSPLIVVDGIPYEGSLNSIPTQDIASLTVLKDAAANSMYGARGSNGVILITTKKGSDGNAKVNFEARLGGNMRGVPTYDIISNPADYYEMSWESIRNMYLASGSTYLASGIAASNELIDKYLKYNIYKGVPNNQLIDPVTGQINPNATQRKWNDNWAIDPFQTGLRQEYNVNISGGSDKSSYYISAGYLEDNGYIQGSGFERFNSRVKVDQEVTKWFKAGANIAYTQTSQDAPSAGGTDYSNLFMFSQSIAPIYPIYLYDQTTGDAILDENGNKKYDFGDQNGRPYASKQNPLSYLGSDIYRYIADNLSLRGYLEFSFLKDFKFTVNASYDVFNFSSTEFMSPTNGNATENGGTGSKAMQRYAAFNTNQLLTYEHDFDGHSVNVLLGHELKMDETEVLSGSMQQFYDPANPEFSNAGTITDLSSYTSGYNIQGLLSRVEYDYSDKYYLSVSFRRDGSSYFAPKVRWGNFWSVGASWRMKEETFLQDVTAIHDLKLKASYGTQGNDALGAGATPYLDQYSLSRVDGMPSPSFAYRGNPNLTWEKSNNFNAGFELGLFDRVNFEADFFIKETNDMLYAKPLPPSGGSPSWMYTNEMDMRNIGVEVQLGATIVKTRNVKWDVDLNLTTYKNALTRLPSDKADVIAQDGGYAAGSYWRSVGGSLYDFYDYHYLGVNAATGSPMYTVKAEDYDPIDDKGKHEWESVAGLEYGQLADGTYFVSQTSYASRLKTGKSALPDLYGGLSTSVEAYGFDFSLQTAFQLGGYVNDSYYASLMHGGEYGQNWHKDIYKRWTLTNTDTDVPRVQASSQSISESSDRWLTSASYLSLRNITLGYTFPKKWLNKAKIRTFRVYVVGDNLALLSARKGLDPRQSFSGETGYSYSAMTTVSGGITLGF